MRNPVAEPWRSALLTEIGEFRRPGNVFDRADIAKGLKEFVSVLKPEPLEESVLKTLRTEAVGRPDATIDTSELVHEPEIISDSVRDHYLDFNKHRL
jgi:hypothetical protein